MKSRHLFFAVCLMLSNPVFAGFFFNASDITGSYTCQWQDSTSHTLYESALLVSKLRYSYLFSWTSSNGKQYIGNGLFNEKNDSSIAVIFHLLGQNNEHGLQLFQILPNGNLTGPWIYQDKSQAGTSLCTKQKKSS